MNKSLELNFGSYVFIVITVIFENCMFFSLLRPIYQLS